MNNLSLQMITQLSAEYVIKLIKSSVFDLELSPAEKRLFTINYNQAISTTLTVEDEVCLEHSGFPVEGCAGCGDTVEDEPQDDYTKTLEQKLIDIECGECAENMLVCKCEEEECPKCNDVMTFDYDESAWWCQNDDCDYGITNPRQED